MFNYFPGQLSGDLLMECEEEEQDVTSKDRDEEETDRVEGS